MGTYFEYIDDIYEGLVYYGDCLNPGRCALTAQMKVACSSATAITFVTIDFDLIYDVRDYAGNVIWWVGLGTTQATR